MCINPLKNPLSGGGLASLAAKHNPISGMGMAKAVLKKRGGAAKAAVAPLPGAVLG